MLLSSSTIIAILSFGSTVISPVESLLNRRLIAPIHHASSYQETTVNLAKEFDLSGGNGRAEDAIRLQHSKHEHQFLKLRPRTARTTIRSKGGRRCTIYQQLSSQLFYTPSPIESSSTRGETVAVYALILASLLSFVGDNVMHIPVFRTWYLYHRKWRWWQPITSTFCHGDKAHLSGNVFLLLLFGRSVEDELGPLGLVFSYIFCGVVANLVSLVMLPKYTVSLGASGAVFGLFSVSIFSRLSWRDIFDWRKIIEVGVLGQYVVSQFLNEAQTVAGGGIAGVNHVAHLSGAVAGFAMIVILRKLIKVLER